MRARLRPPATLPVTPEPPGAGAGIAELDRSGAELLGEVLQLKARISLDFYRMGQRLAVLSRKEVYRDLGYSSFGDLVAKEHLMSRFYAIQLIRITTEYSAPQAQKLGVSKCWALIAYAKAREERPGDLARDDAEIEGTPASQLTVQQLRDAAARERERRRGLSSTKEALEAREAVRTIERKLRARGVHDARVRLLLRGTSWWIRVDVPAALAVLAIVGTALAAPGLARAVGAPRAKRRVRGRGPPS